MNNLSSMFEGLSGSKGSAHIIVPYLQIS